MLTAERRGAAQRLAAAAGELATSADGHAAALRVSELRKAVLHWFEIDNRQAIQSTLGPDRELTSP